MTTGLVAGKSNADVQGAMPDPVPLCGIAATALG